MLFLLILFITIAILWKKRKNNRSKRIYWQQIDALEIQRKEMILERAIERQLFLKNEKATGSR